MDTERQVLKGITLYRLSAKGKVLERLDAQSAGWNGSNWIFRNGQHRKFSEKGAVNSQTFKKAQVAVTEKPADFLQIKKEPGEMNVAEMGDYIRGLRSNGVDDTKYLVDLNAKLAYPMVGIIMALVGIPFSLRTGRSGGLGKSILITLLIGFSYFILFYTGISLGHAGKLPPFIATWSTNIVFIATGIYMMATVRG